MQVRIEPCCEAILTAIYKKIPWYWDIWNDILEQMKLENAYDEEHSEKEHFYIVLKHDIPKYHKVLSKILYVRNAQKVVVHKICVRHKNKEYP